MINLYDHNEQAYRSAVSMLNETGKAAVIHPTGTGKSFIGLKLVEVNPDKIVCWLSPSEYIFKTQIENLKKTSDGFVPQNIKFYTYAKLALMKKDELAGIQPDYIILDEFHRCGAEIWGKGVQSLLKTYPSALLLGLSATNIRYLDNQRDMADELFDGNIASEMTLGESIVRGILKAPKYVLSVFSYQNELEKYTKRIKKAKSKAVRDTAERYLDALKRTLENADGLDEIFYKHMSEPHGKYIVFCANLDHVQEMIELVPEWFSKVDQSPNVYIAYSRDPETSKAFADFKKDHSDHLKLLFCIDMLNEGIHVDDISGVILLRPTVSPIIYKQQIGRALSASSKKDAVIFDVVLNIENLYSIGAVEEEMQIAASYYRSLDEEENIVTEHFKIIDEVKDCRGLFEQLNDTLSASWNLMYAHAKQYYEEFGNLEVSSRYRTADGYSLGSWIFNQRCIRKGQLNGSLTESQIAKLDKIGMVWDSVTDLNWSRYFSAVQKYYEENGDINIPSRYATKDGMALGLWLSNLRTWERSGAHSRYLTKERKDALNSLGMVWDVLDYFWEQNYLAACKYYKEFGNLDVPAAYVSPDGIRLGSWVSRLRKLRSANGKMRGTPPTAEQIARLDRIGMKWNSNLDNKWEAAYSEAVRYAEKNGNLSVPPSYITKSGIALGHWIQRQRTTYKQDKISDERKAKLNLIGMVWEKPDPWMFRFEILKKYYDKYGTLDIPQNTVIDGVWIGKWILQQKKLYEKGEKLTKEQRNVLSSLPLEQVGRENSAWLRQYDSACAYYKKYGNLNVPAKYIGENGCDLSAWLIVQRMNRNQGKLSDEQIRLLDKIGFVWTLESAWNTGYRHAKEYFDKNGNLKIQQKTLCEDGYPLGRWVYAQRKDFKAGILTENQIDDLNKLGMVWKSGGIWDKNYQKACDCFTKNNNTLPTKSNAKTDEEKAVATWIHSQIVCFRQNRLTEEHQSRLEKLGMDFSAIQLSNFDKGYQNAKEYFEKYGALNVASNYQCENGFWLGSWIIKQRENKAKLSSKEIKKLDAIEMVWNPADPWEEKFELAKQYYSKNGCLPLEPKQCKNSDELHLCQWLRRQLLKYNGGKMEQGKIDKLTAIGMDWLNSRERAWEQGFSHAKEYYEHHGDLKVKFLFRCDDGYPLGSWLHDQRKNEKLRADYAERLKEIGMIFSTKYRFGSGYKQNR